jgi:hypothetical protein
MGNTSMADSTFSWQATRDTWMLSSSFVKERPLLVFSRLLAALFPHVVKLTTMAPLPETIGSNDVLLRNVLCARWQNERHAHLYGIFIAVARKTRSFSRVVFENKIDTI